MISESRQPILFSNDDCNIGRIVGLHSLREWELEGWGMEDLVIRGL